MNLVPYIRACYPILYLVTAEESRAELTILEAAKEMKRKLRAWSHTEGFSSPDGNDQDQVEDPIDALNQIKGEAPGTIYVMRDLHSFFTAPKLIRQLRDMARDFKQMQKTLIIISPVKKIPPELERDVTVIEFELPNKKEIEQIWQALYKAHEKKIGEISDEEHERITQSAMGLTTVEAENAFAKAVVEHLTNGNKDKTKLSRLVMKEKANAVKKSGILEYFEANQTAKDIGGLENLKGWLDMRSRAFTKEAREFGLPMPRGILLVGLPGCGKSLSAKAASNILGVPLLRFDVGRVFGGLVGESESNMRLAIQTAEAVGSCVLWIDEMEKAFAGMGSGGSTDGGTSQRVFGNFITWMQEKTTPCFIISTVNKISSLPPELLRKGRFDETFFVGLPSAQEREDILKIHIQKYGRKLDDFTKDDIKKCVEHSEGFSGAEIEEAIVTGLYAAFHNNRELHGADVLRAIKTTNPLSRSRAADLEAMAKWAESNAVNASKATAKKTKAQAGRQLEL